jgi:hypothetical protein
MPLLVHRPICLRWVRQRLGDEYHADNNDDDDDDFTAVHDRGPTRLTENNQQVSFCTLC